MILTALARFSNVIARWKFVVPLVWLGTISYSLYLTHTIVIAFPDAGLRRVGFVGPWYMLVFVVQIMMAVATGWLFFVFVEKRFISQRQTKRIEDGF